jgi:hypothetical protein
MAPHFQVQSLTQKGIGLAVSGELLHLYTAWGGFFVLSPYPKESKRRYEEPKPLKRRAATHP